MRRHLWVVCGVTIVAVAAPAHAQLSRTVGVQVAFPTADLKRGAQTGYGAFLKLETNLPLIGVAAEANWTRFAAKEAPGFSDKASNVFGVQVGPRINLALIRVGLDLAHFSGFKSLDDSGQSGIVPSAALTLGPLEAGASYTRAGDARWFALRGGLRF